MKLIQRIIQKARDGTDDAGGRRKALKRISRNVRKARPRMYNPRTETALPALAQLLHIFHRTLMAAGTVLEGLETSAAWRASLVEGALSKEQREIARRLTVKEIRDKSGEIDPGQLKQGLAESLKRFGRGFSRESIRNIDRVHADAIALYGLARLDYVFMLRKFDKGFRPEEAAKAPRFGPIAGAHICEDLKDLLEAMARIDVEHDWSPVIQALNAHRGIDVLAQKSWKKLLATVQQLRGSKILESIVRLIEENPSYAPSAPLPTGGPGIVRSYVSELRGEVAETLREIARENHLAARRDLTLRVFGQRAFPHRLAHYTSEAAEKLQKRGLPGYRFVDALDCFKAYLIEFHKSEMKQIVNTLVVKGAWSNPAFSRSLSDEYHCSASLLQDLLTFDTDLGDNQKLGVQVKSALSRLDRNRQHTAPALRLVKGIDTIAAGLVERGAKSADAMQTLLSTVLEDRDANPPQVLGNWRQLDGLGTPTLHERAIDARRRLESYTRLLALLQRRGAVNAPASKPEPQAPEQTDVVAEDGSPA